MRVDIVYETSCNQKRNFVRRTTSIARLISRSHSRKLFPLFPLHFISDGPKIAGTRFMYTSSEGCTNDVVYLNAPRDYAVRVLESFLRPSDPSSSDFSTLQYARHTLIRYSFVPAHQIFPWLRIASILMPVIRQARSRRARVLKI